MTNAEEPLPVDAALYPDVAEMGGLPAALAAVAARDGAGVGEIVAGGFHRNVAVALMSDRGRVTVTLVVDRRVFSIRVVVDGYDWAAGGASSLSDVVGVAAAWRGGATLRQLCAAFPFMTTDPVALGYEAGDPLGAYWEVNLTDPELTEVRPLLRAARRHPRLSGLFPRVSHLTLARFALDERDRSQGEVRVLVTRDGHYRVDSSWVDESQTVESIDEAIALAAAQLPAEPSVEEHK